MAISNSLSGFLHLPPPSFPFSLFTIPPPTHCQSLSSLETASFYFHEIAFAFLVVMALSSPMVGFAFFFFFFFWKPTPKFLYQQESQRKQQADKDQAVPPPHHLLSTNQYKLEPLDDSIK